MKQLHTHINDTLSHHTTQPAALTPTPTRMLYTPGGGGQSETILHTHINDTLSSDATQPAAWQLTHIPTRMLYTNLVGEARVKQFYTHTHK